jgi:hypothetical protein
MNAVQIEQKSFETPLVNTESATVSTVPHPLHDLASMRFNPSSRK